MEQSNTFVKNREVRIFISSTFSDMNGNRDQIINKLIPYLRNRYESQNIVINVIDLRWGITDENVLKGNVMDICFREIDKCRPFFIGIVGDRYGSPIPLSQLRDNPQTKSFYEIIKKQYSSYDLSATELEIQYAVLHKMTSNRMESFFLVKDEKKQEWSLKRVLRKIFSRENDELLKIKNLINNIYSCSDSGIRKYQYKDFSSTLIDLEDALSTQIDKYFKNTSWNEYDYTMLNQQFRTRKLSSINYPHNDDYDYISQFILDGDKNILAVYSDDQKQNILLANWIGDNKNNYKIVTYYPTPSHNKRNAFIVGDFINNSLIANTKSSNDNLYKRPDEMPKIWEQVESTIQNISNNEKLIIILPDIDDTDNLDHYILTLVKNLKRKNKNNALKIVLSYNNPSVLTRLLNDDTVVQRKISLLSKEEKLHIIESYLQIYGKQNGLTTEQKECISNMDLHITDMISILDYLVVHSTHDTINDDVVEIVNYISTNKQNIYDYLLGKMETSMTPSEKNAFQCALSFICLSYNGMSEMVLEDLCEDLTALDIIKLVNAFSFQLIHSQGKIVLINSDFSNCIKRRYVNGKEKKIREIIANYYRGKDSYNAYDELLYQYMMLENENEIYQLIAKNKHAIIYYIDNRPLDYVEAWDLLWNIDFDKYNVATIEKTFSTISNNNEIIACNHLSYFLSEYCSDYKTAYLLAQKCSSFFVNTKERSILYPIALFTEAQLLRSEGTMDSLKIAIEKTENAIKEFEQGMAVLETIDNALLNTMAEKRMTEMKEMQVQLYQDINNVSKEHTPNMELYRAASIHKKATYLFTLSNNPQIVLPMYNESLRIREEMCSDTFDLSDLHCQIGYCYYLLGEYYNAIYHLEKAEDFITKLKGEYHYSLRIIYSFLSFCHNMTGSLSTASNYMRKVEDVELHQQKTNQDLVNAVRESIDANDQLRNTLKKAKEILEKLPATDESDHETTRNAITMIDRILNN